MVSEKEKLLGIMAAEMDTWDRESLLKVCKITLLNMYRNETIDNLRRIADEFVKRNGSGNRETTSHLVSKL